MSNSSDSEIIARSFDDPEVFGELFDRHATPIGNYFARRVNREQIESLLSEVFVTAFRSRHTYSTEKSNALPWLFGIAHNHLRHHYRSHRRERLATSRLKSTRESVDVDVASFEGGLVASLDAEDCIRRVEAFIDGQPETDREVLLMYAWEGLSYQQIGEALSVPVGTVRSRLNRIRTKIRELEASHGQLPHQSSERSRLGLQPTISYRTQESRDE